MVIVIWAVCPRHLTIRVDILRLPARVWSDLIVCGLIRVGPLAKYELVHFGRSVFGTEVYLVFRFSLVSLLHSYFVSFVSVSVWRFGLFLLCLWPWRRLALFHVFGFLICICGIIIV